MFGNRPAILIPLTVFAFSPLSLAALTWWAVALEILPLELAIFMAVDAHVRYLRGGRFRSALAAAGWLLLGLAAMDKGAVVPLLLFALTSAFFVEGRWAVAAARASIMLSVSTICTSLQRPAPMETRRAISRLRAVERVI